MTGVITQQSAENMAYVRGLLRRKQPGFSAALELAVVLAELELITPDIMAQGPWRSAEEWSGDWGTFDPAADRHAS